MTACVQHYCLQYQYRYNSLLVHAQHSSYTGVVWNHWVASTVVVVALFLERDPADQHASASQLWPPLQPKSLG